MTYRKKLIEVALPLGAINHESPRERSIRNEPFDAAPVVGSAAASSDAGGDFRQRVHFPPAARRLYPGGDRPLRQPTPPLEQFALVRGQAIQLPQIPVSAADRSRADIRIAAKRLPWESTSTRQPV